MEAVWKDCLKSYKKKYMFRFINFGSIRNDNGGNGNSQWTEPRISKFLSAASQRSPRISNSCLSLVVITKEFQILRCRQTATQKNSEFLGAAARRHPCISNSWKSPAGDTEEFQILACRQSATPKNAFLTNEIIQIYI